MKQVRIDSFFTMGKQHFVCEDYVFTSTDAKAAFLSDGCSSSPHTDLGARLLCLCGAETLIKDHKQYPTGSRSSYISLGLDTIIKASNLLSSFSEIPKEALDATLITASVNKDNQVLIYTYGDGNVALKFKDTPLIVNNYSFLGNAPYYLNYDLGDNLSRLKVYHETMSESNALKHIEAVGEDIRIVEREYNSPNIIHIEDTENLEMVAIMSDGVESFSSVNTRMYIPIYEVIAELLDFKTTMGEFVKRRSRAVVKKYAKDQIYHNDDLSIAVMLFEEEGDVSP